MSRRARIRVWLAAITAAGLAGLAVALAGHLERRAHARAAVSTAIQPDGWRVRGLRRDGHSGDARFSLRASEARVERARLGAFRIGVTRELYAHGVRLDVRRLAPAPAPTPAHDRGRSDGPRERPLTALHLEDVTIRVRELSRAGIALRAARCDAGLGTGTVITCRRVRARTAAERWAFDELRYDVGAGGVLSARGRAPASASASALGRSLRHVAAWRLLQRVWPALGGAAS